MILATAILSRARPPRQVRKWAKRSRARSRLRAVNLRRTTAAAGRAVPAPPPEPAAPNGQVTYGAPRSLLFVTVKRDNPSWRDPYGHWWLEVGDRSYGWWPRAIPVSLRGLVTGTGGVLNGMGVLNHSGTWDKDPQHGWVSAHSFHPVLTLPLSDSEVRDRIRVCAHAYSGGWTWSARAGSARHSCHSFQDALMHSAGLEDGPAHLASRGSGCPFLYRPRTMWWWTQDRSDSFARRVAQLRPSGLRAGVRTDLREAEARP